MSDGFAALLPETPLGRRLVRVIEAAEAHGRLTTLVIVLESSAPAQESPASPPPWPEWAHPLPDGRAVVVIDPDEERAAEILGRVLADPTEKLEPSVLRLELRRGATEGVLSLLGGTWREVCVLGARGDGKSVLGAIAWVLYAHLHRAAGFPLPVRVLVPTTTFTEHAEKLCQTLREPLWLGFWQPTDDGHVWTAALGGTAYAELHLFGVKDQTEQDKLRSQAHGLWTEEAAPAGVEATGGLDETALGIGVTSLRLPSYQHPVLVTSNYGSESHWTWQRYAVRQVPGTKLVRIPPGEWASAEDRAAWMQALDGRPDLQRRLVKGEPALIVAGEGVLHGVWNAQLHVSREPLRPIRGARTLLGHDTGLRPATVVIQELRGQLRVLAALVTEYGGMRQHIATAVLPWLARVGLLDQAPLEHRIDPAGTVGDYGDSDESPEQVIRELLRGPIFAGPVKWAPRIEPVLRALGQIVNGQPRLLVAPGPDTAVLREACEGKWFYPRRADGALVRDLPEKTHPHSDIGDALCYAVGALAPMPPLEKPKPRPPLVYKRILGDFTR